MTQNALVLRHRKGGGDQGNDRGRATCLSRTLRPWTERSCTMQSALDGPDAGIRGQSDEMVSDDLVEEQACRNRPRGCHLWWGSFGDRFTTRIGIYGHRCAGCRLVLPVAKYP